MGVRKVEFPLLVTVWEKTHLAKESSFCCAFPWVLEACPWAPVATCAWDKNTGFGGHWGWSDCLLMHVSGCSASPPSVSMGLWQKFCPATNAAFQNRSATLSFCGQVEEVEHHDCFTCDQFDWLTAGAFVQDTSVLKVGIVRRDRAQIYLKQLFSAELPRVKTWSSLGLRSPQRSEKHTKLFKNSEGRY